MAKIHKSTNISIKDTSPVVLDIPAISKGLRELVLGEERNNVKSNCIDNSYALSVENIYVQSVIENANEQANEIIKKAKSNAAQIEFDAKEKHNEFLKDAQIEGLKKGSQKVKEQVDEFINESRKTIELELKQIENSYKKSVEQIRSEIIELSVAISEKIICFELDKSEKAIQSIVKDALSKIDDGGEIRVNVQQSDLEKVRSLNEIQNKNVKLTGKSAFKNHECTIESIMGRLDASWEKKLVRITDAIKGVNE